MKKSVKAANPDNRVNLIALFQSVPYSEAKSLTLSINKSLFN